MMRIRYVFFLLVAIVLATPASAHVAVEEIENMSAAETYRIYLGLGFEHIIPLGLDHIVFILSLFLLSPQLKTIIIQSTVFTVAHSVTLGLAMYNVVSPPSAIIEPLISISIMLVAFQNIFSNKLKALRIGVVFLFGLIHGLGFASALGELGLPQSRYLAALLVFNLGVELGQLAVILIAWLLIGKWFGKKPFYRSVVVVPASVLIIMLAGYWTFERLVP
jgi:hypothetical protein